jgi:penicillin-binding protein 2
MFEQESDNVDQRQSFTRRAILLGAGQVGLLGIVGGRLWHLQVEEHNRYSLLADENRVNIQSLAPERGRILDRYGQVLATNLESYRAILVPSLAGSVRDTLTRFSRLVAISAEDQERVVLRARRQSTNTPIVIATDLTFEQIAAIGVQSPHLPGISTEAAPKRRYHQGRTVGHIVGYIGAQDRLAMDDDPVVRLPGMRTGKAGIERGQEAVLRGKSGLVQTEVDSRGRPVRHLDRSEPTPGRDIVLTIDTVLQAQVLTKIASFRRAACVVMDVNTGEIPVLASVPTFDPNEVVQGTTARTWQRLQTQRDDPMNNRATRGLYPPGSTFKMVTGLAGLEAGVVTLKEKIDCDGTYEYFDQKFRCWKRSGHGACDFHVAMRESCDCYFYEVARRVGIEALAAMARKLGFGQIYDCGLANLKRGLIPDPDWKRARFNKPWVGGETVLAGIGQGYVLTTPLQLAVMTARLATGLSITPTFIRPPDGAAPQPLQNLAPLPGRPEWHAAIRRAMAAVVNEDGGTGSKARVDGNPYLVAGKTGTSQVSRFSSETAQLDLRWELRDHALFVAYAPVVKPKYAIATIVEHGGGGGSTAAPLSREILDLVMQRDPSSRAVWSGKTVESDGRRRASGAANMQGG